MMLRPLVGVRFQVLFHSLVQGTFHLSLTVLVHYRSLRSIQPYRMVPADSDRVSRAPPYSGYYQVLGIFHLQDFHLLWSNFPEVFYYIPKVHIVVLQPQNCRNNSGLGQPPFARHYSGDHYCFLFLRLLRCFSSPGQLPLRDNTSPRCWVAPFGNLRIIGFYAPTRSLSQPNASFIASESLGIRHTPLFSFLCFCFLFVVIYISIYSLIKITFYYFLIFTISFFQYVNELVANKCRCGEYRSRTDDLLRARQALQPAELIPPITSSQQLVVSSQYNYHSTSRILLCKN